MTKPITMLTTVPFAGFYYTWHDDAFDQCFERMLADDSGNQFDRGDLEMRAFDAVKWHEAQTAYGMRYIERVAEEFEIDMKPESMVSPKEYNFTTDRLFAHIPVKEVRRLFKVTPRDIFTAVVKEEFTSRDGFSSSYPNDWAEWPTIPNWDHNHAGALVKAYIRWKNGGEDMDQSKEVNLMERDEGNGRIDNWICENAPGIERFFTIREYLQKRKDRGEPQRDGLRFLGA